jgi:glycosyltransferase involved in cell wall biosynthesis
MSRSTPSCPLPATPLKAEDITIAVTVYNRREYILQAVRSALDQTVPVRVMVVEDCGPDPTLRDYVLNEFGSRITYHRNPVRRGLFDNWNACLELCPTPWLSILHDDDYLAPDFVEAMIELSTHAPGRGFYIGRSTLIGADGAVHPPADLPGGADWCPLDPAGFALVNHVLFPGQLMNVAAARGLGGFRKHSKFCGDWEMWFKLTARFGGAQTRRIVAFNRAHAGSERGTTAIDRAGLKDVLDHVQRKRNLAFLREIGMPVECCREQFYVESPLPTRLLLKHAWRYRASVLRYNLHLLRASRPPHVGYALVRWLAGIGGAPLVRSLSRLLYGLGAALRRTK